MAFGTVMKSAVTVPSVAGAELSVHACRLGDEEDAWRRQAHHKLRGVLNRSGVAAAWQKSWRAQWLAAYGDDAARRRN